jgi:hypothetical protein
MLSLIRYNLKIVAPTLLWTGILVAILVGLVLFGQFRHPESFNTEAAASLAEQLIPLIAAFFCAGVLDVEMKRGAHELVRSKRRPLWHTVGYRLAVSLAIALLLGWAVLLVLHFGIRRVPVGMLMLASVPSALVLALVSLWTRIRLGNAFIGYMVALAAWLANIILGSLERSPLGISINPLLTLTSYTNRVHAAAAGALETTPYVDWWWVSKLALVGISFIIFISITRRVENLVEGD